MKEKEKRMMMILMREEDLEIMKKIMIAIMMVVWEGVEERQRRAKLTQVFI